MQDPLIHQARKRVKAKKGFYVHLSAYLAVGIFFFLMNILTFRDSHEWWFFFPMLPWLVGLLIHYFVVFGLPGTEILTEGWEEKEMEKELRRLKKKHGQSPVPEKDTLDLPAQEAEELKLDELKKVKDKRWDEEDIV